MRRATPLTDTGRQTGLYFGALWLALGLGAPQAATLALPVQYLLKDHLGVGPQGLALFGAITAIPLYLGFVPGFLRDRWRPLGISDRAYLLVTAPIALASYLWLAVGSATYTRLVTALLLATLAFQVLGTVTQAMATAAARQYQMTGRLSVLACVAQVIPGAVSAAAGGWLVHRVSPAGLFLAAAGLAAALTALAFWRPRAVFNGERRGLRRREARPHAVRGLWRHGPIWPAAAVLCLWNFSPGMHTPLLFHLTEQVGLSSQGYGIFLAVFAATSIPTALLYGCLYRAMPLRRLLWWGTALAVLQGPPVLLCQTPSQAMAVAAATGLIGGFASAAYRNLLMRSCPEGLEGTANALTFSGIALATQGGDLVGTWLYVQYGFGVAVLATAIAYLLIVPVLLFVPQAVVSQREESHVAPTAPLRDMAPGRETVTPLMVV
jgi:predicted MFS family arabinose efflux permease